MASIKIYTKTGDKGTTSLVGGERISKSDFRLEAYGAIDELNAAIGLLDSMLKTETFLETKIFLKKIQNQLFNIGSQLANIDPELAKKLPTISSSTISDMETHIDTMTQPLAALKNFILPGGSPEAAQSHVARTICRRAERECCRLNEDEPVQENIIPYLNRLSDYLFVLSRFVNFKLGIDDVVWEK